MSKRKRAKVFRGAQYGVLIVVVIALAFIGDWGKVQRAFFDPGVAAAVLPEAIMVALRNTVTFTLLGFALGLALGLVLAMMRLSSVAPYRWIATFYIEIFRGLPALLIFIVLGFGIPLAFQVRFDIYTTGMLGLGIIGAAYMAETIRAGLQAVPQGQVEAARSLGMSPFRTMITIVVPQAFRIILPPLTNELILLTKDSSLIYLLGTIASERELAAFGRQMMNQYKGLTPVVVAGLCYLIITIPLSYLSRYLEKRTGGKKVSVV